jgi:hypothetical protein
MHLKQALHLINTVDSRHQAAQHLLRRFAHGEGHTVTDEELDELPSPFAPVVTILKDVRDKNVTESTMTLRDELDTFSEPLKPLLAGLIEGLQR